MASYPHIQRLIRAFGEYDLVFAAPSQRSAALVVQKYGGTSVGTLDRIRVVAAHIAATVRSGRKVVAVVSAMGEHTDELLKMAMELSPKPPRREVDMLLTAGERISTALLSIALHELGIASLSLTGSQSGILTDEVHGNARIQTILGDRLRTGLAEDRVVIVAGFQGMSPKTKEITTLGRGGSDLSAIALAIALGARTCEIYKDVDGVCSADPRYVATARVIERMTWQQMSELAWAGAAVLHPRGAHLASKYELPLEIRSSFNLERRGTVVEGRPSVEGVVVKALAHKNELSLLRVELPAESCAHLTAQGLAWLWHQGESPLVTQCLRQNGTQTVVLTQVLASRLVGAYVQMLETFAPNNHCKMLSHSTGLGAVTVVGEGFAQSPETLVAVTKALDVPVHLVDSRNTAITLCVAQETVAQVLQNLHRALIEPTATA